MDFLPVVTRNEVEDPGYAPGGQEASHAMSCGLALFFYTATAIFNRQMATPTARKTVNFFAIRAGGRCEAWSQGSAAGNISYTSPGSFANVSNRTGAMGPSWHGLKIGSEIARTPTQSRAKTDVEVLEAQATKP